MFQFNSGSVKHVVQRDSGVRRDDDEFDDPASMRSTDGRDGVSARREATTQPEVPPCERSQKMNSKDKEVTNLRQ